MSVEHNYSPLKEFQESKQAGKHALGFLESQIGLMQVRRQPPQNETVFDRRVETQGASEPAGSLSCFCQRVDN